MAKKKRVLFVCLGNICRSPAAEAVLQKVLADRCLGDEIEVDSAGTGSWHVGEPADARMRRAGGARGYRLKSIGRQFEPGDFDDFDLIVAMDRDNLRTLQGQDREQRHKNKTVLFSRFLPGSPEQDVPDPYYGGPQGFDQVLDMIENGCEGIVKRLQDDEKR